MWSNFLCGFACDEMFYFCNFHFSYSQLLKQSGFYELEISLASLNGFGLLIRFLGHMTGRGGQKIQLCFQGAAMMLSLLNLMDIQTKTTSTTTKTTYPSYHNELVK